MTTPNPADDRLITAHSLVGANDQMSIALALIDVAESLRTIAACVDTDATEVDEAGDVKTVASLRTESSLWAPDWAIAFKDERVGQEGGRDD